MVIATKMEKYLRNFKNYEGLLQSTGLFREIEANKLEFLLNCIGVKIKKLEKGKIVLLAGDKPEFTGIVLSGVLHIVREDYDGNRSIITSITPGETFAEALCSAGLSESPFTVIAAADAVIMLLQFSRMLDLCQNSCSFHKQLISNILALIAGKNLFLQNRMEILSLKSVRAKVMLYLESLSFKQGRNITIPFNREEMADFLGIERSALSHELSKMKKDNLIDYRKNNFILKPRSTRKQ